MTFRKLVDNCNIGFQGQACTQDSWFPGYAWTILYCGVCRNHLGWKFTKATSTDSQVFGNESDDEDGLFSDEMTFEGSSESEQSEVGDGDDDTIESESNTEEMTQNSNENDSEEGYFSVHDDQQEATASIASDHSFRSAQSQVVQNAAENNHNSDVNVFQLFW